MGSPAIDSCSVATILRVLLAAHVMEYKGYGGLLMELFDQLHDRPWIKYSGHEGYHGIKYQGLVTPDGLISSLCGPEFGPVGDWKLWKECGSPSQNGLIKVKNSQSNIVRRSNHFTNLFAKGYRNPDYVPTAIQFPPRHRRSTAERKSSSNR